MKKVLKYRGWSDNTEGKALALHTANLVSILSKIYGPQSCEE